jgi:hypothetical protein
MPAFELFPDPDHDARGDTAKMQADLDRLAKDLAQPPAAGPADSAETPAVPPTPLSGRRRRERLGNPTDLHALRAMYRKKSLADAGQGDGIDLDAPVVGHDLDALAEGLAQGLRRQLAAERADLGILAGQQVERALARRLEELAQEWGRQLMEQAAEQERRLAAALADIDRRLAELGQDRARDRAEVRAEVKALERRHEEGLERVADLLAAQPVPQVVLPKDSIRVEVESRTLLDQPPRKSTTTKRIEYGPSGRPEKVIEDLEER